jgi:hypothetical protein
MFYLKYFAPFLAPLSATQLLEFIRLYTSHSKQEVSDFNHILNPSIKSSKVLVSTILKLALFA